MSSLVFSYNVIISWLNTLNSFRICFFYCVTLQPNKWRVSLIYNGSAQQTLKSDLFVPIGDLQHTYKLNETRVVQAKMSVILWLAIMLRRHWALSTGSPHMTEKTFPNDISFHLRTPHKSLLPLFWSRLKACKILQRYCMSLPLINALWNAWSYRKGFIFIDTRPWTICVFGCDALRLVSVAVILNKAIFHREIFKTTIITGSL